jgi:putative glutamine amidotransferase
MMKKAAISKSNSKFHNYVKWLEDGGIPYEILDWEAGNFESIKDCSSLLLTGGVDIHPEFFNESKEPDPNEKYIPSRDEFEFKLLDYALENSYPVLGICRGLQVINTRFKGELIEDIETEKGGNHKKLADGTDRIHEVDVTKDSLLYNIVKETHGKINSSHHQAIESLGTGLMVNAKSTDGIIEGIEWKEKQGKPFFLAIQWHPERMNNMASPFTKNILERFKDETNKIK